MILNSKNGDKMDIRFTVQATEPEVRKLIRMYISLYNRLSRFYGIDLAIAWTIFLIQREIFPWDIILGAVTVLFFGWGIPWLSFLAIWKNFRSIFIANKTFELPTTYHLTDEYIEVEHGKNTSKRFFGDSVTAFYNRNDILILFCGRNLFASFDRSSFPRSEDFDQLVALFRNGNYEDRSKFPVRKALIPWSIGAALLIFGCFWKIA